MVRGVYPVARSPLDLFSVIADRPGERAALLRSGRLPWWSDPEIRISFLRPLASLSTYADYAWLGAARVPARGHWQSLLWWSLCLIAVAGMLERVLPRSIALLACVLFAVDDAHALPVAWSASRAELIGFASVIAALWAHIAWTQRPSRRSRVLAVLALSLGVLAGEHALALFTYVVAYSLIAAPGSMRQRLLGLAPFVLPVVVYFAIHAALGYGASGSSFYSDPFSDTARFAAALPGRVTQLLGDTVFGYTAEWWFGLPPWWTSVAKTGPAHWLLHDDPHVLQLAVGVVAILIVLGGLWHAWRAQSDPVAAQMRWLLAAALASLLPLCGTFAMTRLTVAPALGIDAWLAWIAIRAWQRLRTGGALGPRVVAATLGAAILLFHGVVIAQRTHEASDVYAAWSRNEEAWVDRARLGGHELTTRHAIVISANDIATQFSLPFIRYRHGKSMPASSQLLVPPAFRPIELARTAPNVLELRSTDPAGHPGFRNSAYRLESTDFLAGDRFTTPTFTVEVVAVNAGNPTSLRFTFEKDLEDASYLFLYPREEGLKPLELPPVGTRVQLPPPAAPRTTP